MDNVYVRPENPLRNMAEYMLSMISHFAECKGLDEQQAYRYVKRYGGIKLMNDYYKIMHTLSFKDAIDAMTFQSSKYVYSILEQEMQTGAMA